MRADCFSDEELHELGLASDAELSAEARGHLEQCASCRARRAQEERDAELFQELRGVARHVAALPSIPGYRIENELRRGGQGVVYRALQEATQRVVALKVLAPGSALSARERRRFEREVELGSRLAHPGIVTLFDSGLTAGAPWYAMELVDGETLDLFVARAAPPLARRLALFLELCAAVAHAHRSGVIHRDLKPGNVLVDTTGRVRVLDFGTALAIGPGSFGSLARGRVTAPGEFLGTLAYAAPEQVAGGAEPCDTRADVYALGVMLYELVTGALPLSMEGNLAEVVERIARAAPTPPGRLVPGLERDLAAILAVALEKDRERRYPSVEALARDVAHYRAHEPIEARRPGTAHVLLLALKRHRRGALLGALALVIGALLTGAFVRERLRARRASENATLVRAVIEDILGAAAPQRMGGDAPLRNVLALAASEIETTLEDAPDAQAAVQLTIGDTYRRLLMYPEAEAHLRLALARFRAVDGGGLESARCLTVLGQVLSAQGRAEAIPAQEEALDIRRRLLDGRDARLAESERELALALLAQVRDADVARARALLDSALAHGRAALGEDSVEVAETRLALARIASWGAGKDAEALFAAALATLERHAHDEPRDPRLIECLTGYAAFLRVRQRFDEAEDMLERAERLTREVYGDELTSDLLRRRADIALARGELADAEQLTRRALCFELRRWAAQRPAEAAEIEGVAAALEKKSADEPPYVDAFRLLRRFRGDGAFELATWMNGIARLLRAAQRAPAGEALLREALNIRCRAYGADCPVRQSTLFALAELLAGEQRASEAAALLAESIAIAEHNREPDSAKDARALLAQLTTLNAPASERP